ncbi:MAG TPA: serpin family protein [Verrucomicrobiae bacterium]|jgi:serine protease inhibitor|nr:serpin family protein [Verrucomicrobiae bacterium]
MKIILALCLLAGLANWVAPAMAGYMENAVFAYNRLGFQLLAQCRQSLTNKNYFLSPAGLAFALSMVENGAQGETSRQILATLQVGSMPLAQLNEANRALLDHLTKLDPKVKLEIANAIWIDKRASIKPDFLTVNRLAYDAEVANDDFQDPATVKKINTWVSARTHEKIPTIIEALNPMERLILLDAIYFKGAWRAPFDPKLTHDLPFTLGDGQTTTHPRMSHTGSYAYDEQDGFQAVELPYEGNEISMFIFLPKGGLDNFLKTFRAADFDASNQRMRFRKGTVELPRFKLENEYDLTKVLPPMGMNLAFTRSADFSAMSDEPLFIGFVKQKTYVDVNEQGTEAAAVTAIGVRAMAMMHEPPPFQFVVDRPFFMAIRDRQTGLILFLGAVSDPR